MPSHSVWEPASAAPCPYSSPDHSGVLAQSPHPKTSSTQPTKDTVPTNLRRILPVVIVIQMQFDNYVTVLTALYRSSCWSMWLSLCRFCTLLLTNLTTRRQQPLKHERNKICVTVPRAGLIGTFTGCSRGLFTHSTCPLDVWNDVYITRPGSIHSSQRPRSVSVQSPCHTVNWCANFQFERSRVKVTYRAL